ncbi:MAG: DNA polymerase I, partial [Firmicutes bacterium]|nr:DNA polymerase I [Bacillota bacterium]
GLPAADPVRFLPALCQKLRDTLVSRDMMKLYTEMELPLSEVLARMELAGIRADAGRLREMSVELAEAADKYQKRIYEQAGHEFNINSPKQLGTVLFEELGIPPLKKTRSGYSTDAEVLETLALTQPICQDILDYRFVTKLRSTYTEGLSRLVAADGKIHTCFKQTVTATGRLSSVEPNLQNIPIRQEEGRRIRRVFMPDETGDYLLAADYSQIELRVLAHISGDAKLRQAYIDEEDIHARTASEVFGVPIDQVTPDLRRAAKAVNFGIVYGISSFGLSRDLGVSRNEAQQYIDRYLARYPDVAAYQARIILEAKEKGYVETLFGRRRYLPDLLSRNFNLRSFAQRVAMNAPIQGSAADIIKLAMISVDRDMRERGLASKMLLQVHDELIFNVPEGELEIMKELVRQHMEHAVELSVPLTVDVKAGHDWYAMEEI